MALNNSMQRATGADFDDIREPQEGEEEEKEDAELEELEEEVKHMAKKILEYRATLPNQLNTTLASLLSAQRPLLPDTDYGSEAGPCGEAGPGLGGQVKSHKAPLVAEDGQKTVQKLQLLKDKISSNISAMPVVLKRMRECMLKIDKLNSYSGVIHPAFKKKKIS